MYGPDGLLEKYEIFNFGKSGATIDFVLKTLPTQLEQYGRDGRKIAIVNMGGNNAKAEGKPDNYVSTLEEFSEEMSQLLGMLNDSFDHTIAVGSGFVNESKTNPRLNPITGGQSFFNNERKKEFEDRYKLLSEERGITFVEVGINEKEWKKIHL